MAADIVAADTVIAGFPAGPFPAGPWLTLAGVTYLFAKAVLERPVLGALVPLACRSC